MTRRWKRVIRWAMLVVLVLVGVRLIAGFITGRLVTARVEALHAAGEPTSLEEMVPPEVPDSENAAVFYVQALQAIEALPEAHLDYLRRLSNMVDPLDNVDIAAARQLVDAASEPLRLLREGAMRSDCRYPIDYEVSPERLYVRDPLWEAWYDATELLRVSSHLKLVDGEPDAAIEECIVWLAFAHSKHNEPLLYPVLRATSSTREACKQVMAILNVSEPSEDALRRLLAALPAELDRESLLLALRGNRCELLAYARIVLDNPSALLRAYSVYDEGGMHWRTWAMHLLRPHSEIDLVRALDVMQRWIGFVEQSPMPEWTPGWQVGILVDGPPWFCPFSPTLDHRLSSKVRSFFCVDTAARCTRLAVALRLYRLKYGEYPERLSALVPEFIEKMPVDPFIGGGFVYHRQGTGFVVYGVGPDGKDNGAQERDGPDPEGDIVCRCAR